jgi:hypothetical protein
MKRLTKKDLALSLHGAGRTVEEIARALETHPSYVANVLAAAGKTTDYSDLYVSTAAQGGYGKQFQGILRFRDLPSARESVERLDAIYHEFERARDRRGQHQAQLLALVGKNRAEGIGKFAEAQVFADWLISHLAVHRPEMEGAMPPPDEDSDLFGGAYRFAS